MDITPDRFNVKGWYHPDGNHHGSTNVTRSYLLQEDLRAFDPGFLVSVLMKLSQWILSSDYSSKLCTKLWRQADILSRACVDPTAQCRLAP